MSVANVDHPSPVDHHSPVDHASPVDNTKEPSEQVTAQVKY